MTAELADSGDGICEALIAEYLRAIERHEFPSREELIRKHPELASALRARFIEMDLAGTVAASPIVRAGKSTVVESGEARASSILGGRYQLLEAIGEGGMGSVWLAEQQIPVKRKVAIKLIKAGMDSEQMLGRFEAERQALAVMDHPNIAKVFDGGLTEQGRPYFVMEYVQGVPFTEYCDRQRLSLNARLQLFVRICAAVQHAHYKGIVHRDLKPSNILICMDQDQPVPKVIDFGLAKAMHQSLTETSIHTGYGVMIGTPLYMSPEQADHGILDVDTRADVYSLGVVLYELLTATTPLERWQLQKAGLHDIVRLIKEEEPIRPSIRLKARGQLASVAANRSIDPQRLFRSLAGDLDWIVIKSLEKERSRRYETANELARDIERFLGGEPVEACPPTAIYRLKKFINRHWGQVIAAVLILVTLVVGMIGTSWGMARAAHFRKKAEDALVQEQEHKRRAEESESFTLVNFRESTDDVIEHLIGAKKRLGPSERAYLERSLIRWKSFANRRGDDPLNQKYQAEGYSRIGLVWFNLGQLKDGQAAFEKALVLQRKQAEQFPENLEYQHDLATTYSNLGTLLIDAGDHSTARRRLERALNIQRKLVARAPANFEYQRNLAATSNNLGKLLLDLGELTIARTTLEQALKDQKTLVEEGPANLDYQQDLAISHSNLGNVLSRIGDLKAARTAHDRALALQLKTIQQFPNATECERSLGRTYCNLAKLLFDSGDREGSREHYMLAQNLQRRLAQQFPADPDYRMDLAKSLLDWGLSVTDPADQETKQKAFEQALELQQQLVEQFPGVPEYEGDLATTHNNLASLNLKLGAAAAAQKGFEDARTLQLSLFERFPKVPEYQRNLGGTIANLAGLQRKHGNLAESLNLYNKAVALLTAEAVVSSRDSTSKELIRNGFFGRAIVHREMNQFAEAAADWNQCVTLSPPELVPAFRLERADAWMRSGRTAEAVAEVEDLVRQGMTNTPSSPRWSTDDWYHFVCLYSLASEKIDSAAVKYGDQAMYLLRYVIKSGYNTASAVQHMSRDTDLDPLRNREDFKNLMEPLSPQPANPAEPPLPK